MKSKKKQFIHGKYKRNLAQKTQKSKNLHLKSVQILKINSKIHFNKEKCHCCQLQAVLASKKNQCDEALMFDENKATAILSDSPSVAQLFCDCVA